MDSLKNNHASITPKRFSRFKRSCRSSLSRKSCTAQADSAFPPASQSMRSGFVLRPLPSHYPVSVQGFYPTLVKRGDARLGFSSPILICIKSQNTLHKTTHIVMLSGAETSQTKVPQLSRVTNYPSQKKAQTFPDRKKSPDKYLPIAERKHAHNPLRQRF